MKAKSLKEVFENARPLAVYADSAFTGYLIYGYETGFFTFVILARQFTDGTKKFFKRKLETEFNEEFYGKDFFRLYGQKFYLEDFLAV